MSARNPPPPPVFFDLDECLVYARERSAPPLAVRPTAETKTIGDYEVWLRPKGKELLRLARAGGREVYLFTMSAFLFAEGVTQAFGLGFTKRTIFSMAMILNCRRGLSPHSALIDNLPLGHVNTQEKVAALGIGPERVWVSPSFKPPRFASAKLFLMGLPARLERLDLQRGPNDRH
jgi:hypothetical protein